MALSADSGMKVTSSVDTDTVPIDDGDGDTARRGGGSSIKVLVILVSLVVLAGGIWIGFGDRMMAMIGPSDGDVPVIAANPAPIKVRPENPGGMQVPNQGRLVYGVVDGSSAQPRVERLLPSPEKPVAVDEVLKRSVPETSAVASANAPRGTADLNTAPVRLTPAPPPLAPVPSAEDVSKLTAAPAPAPAPVKEAAPVVEQAVAPKVTTTPAPPPVPKAAPEVPAPPAPKPALETQTARATPAPEAPVTDLNKSYRIQLAASRTESAVVSEWDRLRRRHIDLLGDLQLQVMKIDLGKTKGIFYRLRAGPLSNATSAKALCERLKQRKLGCLVVKPGA